MIQDVYQNTFNLEIVVVFQHLFTTQNDPYSGDPTTPAGGEILLGEMKDYWQNNFNYVDRDLAHLFVGRMSGVTGGGWVGHSYYNSVCNTENTYGYTKDLTNQFTRTAHEIGHSIGGLHGHGRNCGTENATVMCVGPKAIPLVFSTTAINAIESYLNAHPECLLESPTPTISDNNPYSEICNGDAWTYTAVLPDGYPINYGFDWYATGGLKINGQSTSSSSPLHTTSNSVTVTAPSSAYGTAYVYVRTNNNDCDPSNYVNSQTQAGPYSSSQFSISGPSSVCPGNTASYLSTFIDPGITNYQWGWSGFTYQSGQGTPYLGVYAPYNFNGGSVTLRLQNRCGLTGSPAYKYVYKGYCGYGFTVNPNPAFTELTIQIESPEDQMDIFQSSEENTVELLLTDEAGLIVIRKKLVKRKEIIDVSTLKPDVYYIKIFINNNQIDKTKRIVKK